MPDTEGGLGVDVDHGAVGQHGLCVLVPFSPMDGCSTQCLFDRDPIFARVDKK